IPFETSILRQLQAQFPTISDISITSSGGVQVYVVIAMKPRYEGEARQAILAAMSSNLHPKWVVAVDPDIDIRNSAEVEWAKSFRVKPREDVFVVDRTAAARWIRRRMAVFRRRWASTRPYPSAWTFRRCR